MSDLELRTVSHRYPGADRDVMRDVSLTVPDGHLVSVVGPSGSGKTTLLRVASGLERPLHGQVLVNGDDVTGLPTERRDLTVMFQDPHLFEHLDVGGNVAFAPRLSGSGRREARRCADRYLRLVHLEGMSGRAVASLSGGQQQRVALARALAAERGAMLLDEPFSSLDRELRSSMHDLLAEVRAALAPTILMITHDLDEAGLADSTVVLIDGQVHQHAPARLLHSEPATLATARLVGGFTEVPGRAVGGRHTSAWGTLDLAGHCPSHGDAVLLLRRESLVLTPADSARPAFGRAGQVSRIRPVGARQVVTVTGPDGEQAEVELPPGQVVDPGAHVIVSLRADCRPWAVPGPLRAVAPDAEVPSAEPDVAQLVDEVG